MTPEIMRHPIATKSHSLRLNRALCAAAAVALLAFAVVAPAPAQTPTLLVLRAVPAKLKKGETAAALPPLTKADLGDIKIGGKVAPVTDFGPLLKGSHNLQLMVILDSMQQLGSGGQFDDLAKFMHDMPPNVEIGVGWLLQSQVKITQPFTTDHDLAAKALVPQTREQAANPKNDNGNPYQCLRWISAHWPDADPGKVRAILMFTDGIIRGNGQSQGGDQLNPDVDGASQSLQRAGIVPYPFFWMDPILPDPNRPEGGSLEGQQNFSQLVADTGGKALDQGMFAPGSLSPLLDTLYSTLASEAVVTVAAPGSAGKFARLDIKSPREDISIFGPDSVTIGNVLKK